MKAIAVAIVSFVMVLSKLALVLSLTAVACASRVEGDDEPEPTQEELDELSCAECTIEICVGSLSRCEDRSRCEEVLECVKDEASSSDEAGDDFSNPAFECADQHNLLSELVWQDAAECSGTRCGACESP